MLNKMLKEQLNMKTSKGYKIALNTLKDKEKEVITLRFGLKNGSRKTLEEIGNMYGVTKECIRQMEKRAIKKSAKHL